MDKRAVQEHAVFLCLLVVAVHLVISSSSSTSWWSLSVSSLSNPSADTSTVDCSNSTYLASPFAQATCASDKKIVLAIARGTKAAIVQCQMEFANSRWNCTTFLGQYLFGKFLTLGTAESAAVYSFMSAGAAHELAQACRTGAVSNCQCEIVGDVRTQDAQGNIIFNDCSDNIQYASNTVLQFIKDNSTNISDVDVVNYHNYQVGLQVLSQRNSTCLCHGVSGTCTVQTCYQQVPDVSSFGDTLSWKYINAKQVTRVPGTTTLRPVYSASLNQSDLAYIAGSPDFCTANNDMGILGTSGRKCNPTSQGLDSCYYLCCSRGYTTKTTIVPQQCCQFVWCCRIECTNCKNVTVTDYYCN